MKPYDIRESELTYCPNCGSQNYDLVKTVDNEEGCTDCIGECGYCGNDTLTSDMHIGHIHKDGDWAKTRICTFCKGLCDEDPLGYDDISMEDPHRGLDLLDKFGEMFKP